MPGFNDAQVRFADGGTQLDSVDLTDAGTPAEFARRIMNLGVQTALGGRNIDDLAAPDAS